jgi:hypothetical protein
MRASERVSENGWYTRRHVIANGGVNALELRIFLEWLGILIIVGCIYNFQCVVHIV